MCVYYVRLDFFFRRVFNNNEEEKIDKIFFCCFLLSCKRTMKNSTSAKTHQIPFAWLYGTGGTWDKIQLCLRYLGQDSTLPAVPGIRHRYRNRTLPWTLPPVPQVPLQLYGNQAWVEWVGAKYSLSLSYNYTMRFIGYDSIQTRWFTSYRFQIRTIK